MFCDITYCLYLCAVFSSVSRLNNSKCSQFWLLTKKFKNNNFFSTGNASNSKRKNLKY